MNRKIKDFSFRLLYFFHFGFSIGIEYPCYSILEEVEKER